MSTRARILAAVFGLLVFALMHYIGLGHAQ